MEAKVIEQLYRSTENLMGVEPFSLNYLSVDKIAFILSLLLKEDKNGIPLFETMKAKLADCSSDEDEDDEYDCEEEDEINEDHESHEVHKDHQEVHKMNEHLDKFESSFEYQRDKDELSLWLRIAGSFKMSKDILEYIDKEELSIMNEKYDEISLSISKNPTPLSDILKRMND
jgi:hypothetical protein